MPVITPTGYREGKANWPAKSPVRTSTEPIRAEMIKLLRPLPASLAAMGPERNATEAIGPVTETANAISTMEQSIRSSRMVFMCTPSVME